MPGLYSSLFNTYRYVFICVLVLLIDIFLYLSILKVRTTIFWMGGGYEKMTGVTLCESVFIIFLIFCA